MSRDSRAGTYCITGYRTHSHSFKVVVVCTWYSVRCIDFQTTWGEMGVQPIPSRLESAMLIHAYSIHVDYSTEDLIL